jgi:photosystem II stability/assembly factor-like uncharacterized protein
LAVADPAAPLRLRGGALLLLALAATAPPAANGDGEAQLAPLAQHSLLLDCTISGDTQLAAGERGHILIHNANNWSQATVPTQQTLTAIASNSSGVVIAVGHDLTILRSENRGQSWSKTHQLADEDRPLLDVTFLDEQRLLAVGAYGLLMRSDDTGQSWDLDELRLSNPDSEGLMPGEEPLPPDFHLNAIARADDGKLYIAAEAGHLYRSDDDGDSWRNLPSPYNGSFFGLLTLDDNSLLAFGLRGKLFRSDDSGESWRELGSGSEQLLTNGLRLNGTSYLAGLGGTLLHSTDSVQFQRIDTGGRAALTCLLPRNNGLTATSDAGLLELPAAELPR